MRTPLAATLATCLLLAALAGCGGGGREGNETERVEAVVTDEVAGDGSRASVAEVAIDGPRASAEVAIVGGGLDGQTIAVRLVERDGEWRLARIAGFAEYDPEALARALEGRFEAASDMVTSAQVECLGEAVRGASRAEAEALALAESPRSLVELATSCR